jgi:FAD synthetase
MNGFGPFTIIANNPDQTCFADPVFDLRETESLRSSIETLGPFQVLASDPSTQCYAEVNDQGANGVNLLPRYRPAYELQDGALERAGRVSGAIPLVKPEI